METLNAFAIEAGRVYLELAPWLLLGAIVAGFLHVALPIGFVRRKLVGFKGVLTAVMVGLPLPLCSCGVIPAGLGLKKDGASDGATVAFMVSTPQTGVDSVVVSAAFLGLPFAIFKVFSAALMGLLAGVLAEFQPNTQPPVTEVPSNDASGSRLKDGFDHGLMVLRSIWGWVVFGVLL
ncbi:MAG: permease, partial [Myxococcota bacterium]|nr:permease [Myxococcota bacterium]